MLPMYIIVLVLFCVLWFIREKWIQRNRPPGPFRFPIVGNIVQLALKNYKNKKPIFEFFEDLSLEYGPMFRFQAGSVSSVVLSDFDLIKKMSSDPTDLWVDRPQDEWILERSYGKGIGILFTCSDYWKESRRFCLKTLKDLGLGKQSSRDSLIHEQLSLLLDATKEKLGSDGKVILNSFGYFDVSTLNIIFGLVTGIHYSLDNKATNDLIKDMRGLVKYYSLAGNILNAFPKLRHIVPWLTGYGKERRILEPMFLDKFRQVLEKRKLEYNVEEDPRDFTDAFLQRKSYAKPGTIEEQVYSDKSYAVTVSDLFLAGTETTGNSMGFGLLFMLREQGIQKTVQEEIDRIIGQSRLPEYNDIQQMPYTEATLLEILRISTVVPLVVRVPNCDTTLNGYEIPKGTQMVCNIYQLLKDPKIWKNPNDFNPERFLDTEGKISQDVKGKMVAFGIGRRVCLGEHLARSSFFIFFTAFLQKYTILPVPGETIPNIEKLIGLTVSPKPYNFMLVSRE